MKNGAYGFGIIGLGAIADVHAKAIATLDDGVLVACFDMVPGKAEKFCEGHGGKPYSKLEEFLQDPELDIVTVTTPSGAHLEVALAALRAKKTVIVEKPMEITTERIDQLIKTAKENHVMLAGVFQSRFFDAPKAVKAAIDAGRFGRISLINAQVEWYRSQDYYDKIGWHGTWKMDGGGALMNQAIHAIDLLGWFGGPVDEIYGQTACLSHERIEVEDVAAATVRFKNGTLGIIEGTTGCYPGFSKRIEVCGSKGSAIIEEENLVYWHFDEEGPEDEEIRRRCMGSTSNGGAHNPLDVGFIGHAREFANVVDAMKHHTVPAIPGEEARKAVEIITTIYQSAREHRPIKLDS